jgi:uncharacterized protein (DUF2235 family)
MSKPRNLVICCDGTNNQIAGPPTNVRRLYSMLVRDPDQITYYDSGVGTTPAADFVTDWGRTLGKTLDGAIGLSIRHHMLKAYRWLVTNFQPGDQIWLFGFSRGAYTARALAAALFSFGILRPELLGLEDLLWENFDRTRNQQEGNFFETTHNFRMTFSRSDDPAWGTGAHCRVKIHFCGVWDTVSAFGTIWDMKSLPYTANCPSLVHIRHALALDERRTMFRANLFRPGVKTPQQPVKYLESLKQVWFPGVHSDVGGGYADCQLAKIALDWMVREAELLGLRIDALKKQTILEGDPKLHGPPANPCGPIHESLVKGWNLVELLPSRRFDDSQKRDGWFAPNFWRPRPVLNFDDNGQKALPVLHQAVEDRLHGGCGYRPRNLPPKGQYTIER